MCEEGGAKQNSRSDTLFTVNFAAGPKSLCPNLETGRYGAGSARASDCTILIAEIVINTWGLWRVI